MVKNRQVLSKGKASAGVIGVNMKRIYAYLMILALLLSLTACGATNDQETVPVSVDQAALSDVIRETGSFLKSAVTDPGFGSVGGEWLILGLARSDLDIPEEYFETYFQNLSAYTAQLGGVLHNKKYTEYSRVILAVTAIGKEPTDVGGYNMLKPLADFEKTVFQGINGPIFALLALNSGNYEIPKLEGDGVQATREAYVDYILTAQLSDGGWALSGNTADVDITAMALQALANYKDDSKVSKAIDKGLAFLASKQNADGGFTAYDAESSESVAQVLVALTELGVPMNDARFVKNGKTLVDVLLGYRRADGGFSHLPDGKTDLLATEQAFYALVAVSRMLAGEASLYSMK